MASDPITHFDPHPERLPGLPPGMGGPAGGATEGEWETTLVSRRTVVYGSGAVARAGDPVRFAVDPDELALCRRLTAEADGLLAGVDTGLGSESTMNFRGFFVAGDAGDPVPD